MKSVTRTGRGSALVELLAALPLMALLGVVAVQLSLAAHRSALRVDASTAADRELRQSANVLANEFRRLRARDVRVVLDTAIEFDGTVGIGVVCAFDISRQQLGLAVGTPDDAWSLPWAQSPQSGDQVSLWQQRVADTAPQPLAATLRATHSAPACAGSPLVPMVGGVSTVLDLQAPLSQLPLVGAPARITRRTRYALYRGSDGDWYLGRRTLGPLGWDVIQPVAGPLLSATQRGLRLTAFDVAGQAIASGDTVTPIARIDVQLHAPRRVGRASVTAGRVDSLTVRAALRGESGVPVP